ncbi:MAG: hypothetical protein ACLPY1_10565 [Terracidiphilus sp.]
MLELIEKPIARLPLDFRVLYRQFLLRVIDLEALSIQADVTAFLGQFAGVLIMLSLVHATVTYLGYAFITEPAERFAFLLHMQHYLIATMMLVAGMFAVLSWDATFPDRRDVLVLSPLPVATHTILIAKVSANAAVLGLAIITLNGASGVVMPLIMGAQPGPALGFFQSLPAWWFTIVAASLFLYGSVLTIQGFTALLLPRRMFLRLSAVLQLAAFGLFLGVYFVQPSITTLAAMAAPENHWVLACSPSYWFLATFNQLNGSLPPQFAWIAFRAWTGLAVAVAGAASSLLLCYMHTMKKTVEEPDLVSGGGLQWMPSIGNTLHTAIAHFSIRSLARSRQHRVAFAFYLAFVLGIALSLLRGEVAAEAPRPLSLDLLIPTFLMMFFAVVGLRNVFSLPISLTANWVLRTTQVRPSQDYVEATRRSLQLLAVLPVWLLSAALAYGFRPVSQVAAHLAVLALLGFILVELCLIGFYKVPFTCSYLPGKTNIQFAFWGFVIVLLAVIVPCAEFELRALHQADRCGFMLSLLIGLAVALLAYNNHRAKSAVIYFEEIPDEVITTLRLSA